MCSKQVFTGLIFLPVVIVTFGAKATVGVDLLNLLHVGWWHGKALSWLLDEEGIVHVSCWMTLGLEQRIEVPEGALNISVRGHLFETHLEEDLLELLSNQEERMQMTTSAWCTFRVEIETFEFGLLPNSSSEHFRG